MYKAVTICRTFNWKLTQCKPLSTDSAAIYTSMDQLGKEGDLPLPRPPCPSNGVAIFPGARVGRARWVRDANSKPCVLLSPI